MTWPIYIVITGMMGSGKTTVARSLASQFGWSYVPEIRLAGERVKELFQQPSRWAFEVQTSFLVNKATQLRSALASSTGVILDRSLEEDVFIFAEYFHKNGFLDDRAYSIYQTIAKYFLEEIQSPDLAIHCRCSLPVLEARVAERADGFYSIYPSGHMKEISDLYSKWLDSYNGSPMYMLDTELVDIRTKRVLEDISREMSSLLYSDDNEGKQLDLFGQVLGNVSKKETMYLVPVNISARPHLKKRQIVSPSQSRGTRFPTAYIAAPFTEYAIDPETGENDLLPDKPIHGFIHEGEYRDFLLGIERGLKYYGVYSFIPHRDINKWGSKRLTSKQVMTACTRMVSECDLFVGVLGKSLGSHYEFGFALGQSKPCILIRTTTIEDSFFIKGATLDIGNILVLNMGIQDTVELILKRPDVRLFLQQHLPLSIGASK